MWVYDPNQYKFNSYSAAGSFIGGGVSGALTHYANPISGLIIGSMPEAAIESVAYYLGERGRHK